MNQQKYLTRIEASDYCKSRGVPVEKNTLQKYATIGGGPNYRKFGNRALYTEADLDSWIASRLSEPRSHSSEAA